MQTISLTQKMSFHLFSSLLYCLLFSIFYLQDPMVFRSVWQPVRRQWRTRMWWIWVQFDRAWNASSSSWTAVSQEPYPMLPSLLLLWTWYVSECTNPVFCTWYVTSGCFMSPKSSHHDISAFWFLQEAPVVARASLFLECARFVHRCNRGNWPEWMKGHHVNITKRGLSRGRSPIVGNKRNQKLQWNAAKHFCQWGDVSLRFCKGFWLLTPTIYSSLASFMYFIHSGNRNKAEWTLSLWQRESCQHPGLHLRWGDQTENEKRRWGRGLFRWQWAKNWAY